MITLFRSREDLSVLSLYGYRVVAVLERANQISFMGKRSTNTLKYSTFKIKFGFELNTGCFKKEKGVQI